MSNIDLVFDIFQSVFIYNAHSQFLTSWCQGAISYNSCLLLAFVERMLNSIMYVQNIVKLIQQDKDHPQHALKDV